MNLKEAKSIAMLRGEVNETDIDKTLLYHYADLAQKKIAYYGKHILKEVYCEVNDEKGNFINLQDFYKLAKGKVVNNEDREKPVKFYIDNEGWLNFLENQGGSYTIYYYAKPKTITPQTADTYDFEVPEDTHVAIPYYIAYEIAKIDDVDIAQICLTEWERYMSLFADEETAVTKEIENSYKLR